MEITEDMLKNLNYRLLNGSFFVKGVDIDYFIWPLVRVFNLHGYKTMASCEGHYPTTYSPHLLPWVRLGMENYNANDQKRILRVRQVVSEFEHQGIRWDVVKGDPGVEYFNFVVPITLQPIEDLQASVWPVSEHIEKRLR